jgi:nucleoside triphosphate diphosphatase
MAETAKNPAMTGKRDDQPAPAGSGAHPSPRALNPSGDAFKDLVELMARLRTPGSGCPWDLEQTFASIAPYTIEEAYEVADAIERQDMAELKSELGDLLFQSLFHARMAEELGAFSIQDVIQGLLDKMISRHPHVFGDGAIETSGQQVLAWEVMKAAERTAKLSTEADGGGMASALDGVALALPALMRAEKLTKRAGRVGFDWPAPGPVLDKLDEEIGELKEAIAAPVHDQAHIEEELGDMLFVVANLCRKLQVDPEVALRGANAKFIRRFHGMEGLAHARGVEFGSLTLEQQEALWVEVKLAERQSP